MEDKGLSEFKLFSGQLRLKHNVITLDFSIRFNHAGKVEFDLGKIALTNKTMFIMESQRCEGPEFTKFSLTGASIDGFEFVTDDLYFVSIGHNFSSEKGSHISPIGVCSKAEFHRKLSEPVSQPEIRMHVKGFQNFRQLKSTCELGTITMDGKSSIEDPDTLTGYIKISPENRPNNISEWRTESDKLLEHIRIVMSFASAVMLQVPIIEYFIDDDLEVVALSQVGQANAPMRTINYLNQQSVFDSAVIAFFNPPIIVKNLFFAIEWFAMESTYNEVRLVNAMTVLENLVTSNLSDKDVMIKPAKEFDKIRKTLRQVIKKCIAKWPPEDGERSSEVLSELNERLLDLNRRSIYKKFKILIKNWSVPLYGINEHDFKAAKRARDLIVHRGYYYEEEREGTVDLWRHVTVIREIIVRIFLTAIGYKGSYCSYLGGYHEAQFPPQACTNTI